MDGASIYLMTIPFDGRNTWTSDTLREDARRGLQPELVCLLPQIREPFTESIRFDPNAGPRPVLNRIAPGGGIWIDCSSEFLFVGAPNLPGVWALPKDEIRAELDRQLKSRSPVSQSEQTNEKPEAREKALFAKYDLNHNGRFDPEEREAAISDPSFLEFDLDNIDTNHNGLLDVDELSYFDANKNGRLDPAEALGVRAVQQILAEKALKEFDWNKDGRLESPEFSEFSRNKASGAAFRAWQSAPNGSEVERIQRYLEAATGEKLEERLSQRIPGWNPRSFFGFEQQQNNSTTLTHEINMYWSKEKARF
jgi:Ca2+-binding EF-hand superfamily protein